jgi:hypothetical protein
VLSFPKNLGPLYCPAVALKFLSGLPRLAHQSGAAFSGYVHRDSLGDISRTRAARALADSAPQRPTRRGLVWTTLVGQTGARLFLWAICPSHFWTCFWHGNLALANPTCQHDFLEAVDGVGNTYIM